MKADFICVYDLIEHNIKNVKHKELIENKVLVPADEWAEFLEEYSDVINALINKSSVFINTIAEVPYAYNNYSNCFSAVATCLYQRMREEAIIAKSVETIICRHWYFNLKTLTYCYCKRISDEISALIPIKIWKSFVAKRQWGRLINEVTLSEINIRARELWFNENDINREEFLKEYV